MDVNTLHRDENAGQLGMNEIGGVRLRLHSADLRRPVRTQPDHRRPHPHRRGDQRHGRRRHDHRSPMSRYGKTSRLFYPLLPMIVLFNCGIVTVTQLRGQFTSPVSGILMAFPHTRARRRIATGKPQRRRELLQWEHEWNNQASQDMQGLRMKGAGAHDDGRHDDAAAPR